MRIRGYSKQKAFGPVLAFRRSSISVSYVMKLFKDYRARQPETCLERIVIYQKIPVTESSLHTK